LDKEDSKYNTSYIEIKVAPDTLSYTHHSSKEDLNRREYLATANGTVFHETKVDAKYTVCARAPPHDFEKKNKGPRQVYRYALRLRTTEESPKMPLDHHLSAMEEEMERIQTAMKNILHQADYAKDKDSEMHKQFLAMQSTTLYWPVVQLCVLLVTGFTQVRHIVHFFKRRRII
jgi:hypothetical protein